MGGGLAYLAARQHADLTGSPQNLIDPDDRGTADPVIGPAVLILLAIDGVICAVVAALFLPLHIGVVPFPISAVLAGLVNTALVWAAMSWTSSNRLAALPLWTWLATIVALTFGGPGGDIVFNDIGPLLLLVVLGAVPAAWLLWRRTQRDQPPPSERLLANRNKIRQV
jgi:hypothetical protein